MVKILQQVFSSGQGWTPAAADGNGKKRRRPCLQFLIFCVVIPFMMAVDVAMMVAGAENRDNCPMEPMIPTYLIVYGAGLFTMSFTKLALRLRYLLNKSGVKSAVDYAMWAILALLFTFNLFWTVFYSFYVFPHTDYWNAHAQDKDVPCNTVVWHFAYKALVTHIILFSLALLAGAFFGGRYLCKKMDGTTVNSAKVESNGAGE